MDITYYYLLGWCSEVYEKHARKTRPVSMEYASGRKHCSAKCDESRKIYCCQKRNYEVKSIQCYGLYHNHN